MNIKQLQRSLLVQSVWQCGESNNISPLHSNSPIFLQMCREPDWSRSENHIDWTQFSTANTCTCTCVLEDKKQAMKISAISICGEEDQGKSMKDSLPRVLLCSISLSIHHRLNKWCYLKHFDTIVKLLQKY